MPKVQVNEKSVAKATLCNKFENVGVETMLKHVSQNEKIHWAAQKVSIFPCRTIDNIRLGWVLLGLVGSC